MFEEAAAGLSRRAFVALMVSSTLTKLLASSPPTPVPTPVPPPLPEGVIPKEADRLGRLCGTPLQWFEPQRTLMWAELPVTEGGPPRVMFWTPETPAEHAAADRFFRAATWRSWSTDADLADLLRTSGRWLVRIRAVGGQCLFVANDPTGKPPAASDDAGLTPLVTEAAVVSPAQARVLVDGLNESWGVGPDHAMYFEPVLPDRPLADPRSDFLRIAV